MKILLKQLRLVTKLTVEVVEFSPQVTFIHGPVSTGKSTVARLIDYCLGGRLERTPAIRSEFIAAELSAQLGSFSVLFERGDSDASNVRVTWDAGAGKMGAVNAPLQAAVSPIYGDDVFNLSDLIFKLCGAEPIKVRRSKMDPDSPLVRLSYRDVMWYCYLEQSVLDSSFFHLEDPIRRNKSRDVMRFLTGLYSERMNELEGQLVAVQQSQRSKREAVSQIRQFMGQFDLQSESEFSEQIKNVEAALKEAVEARERLDLSNKAETHIVEPLREKLRELSAEIDQLREAISEVRQRISDQEALYSELITAKIKASRVDEASRILGNVTFSRCPQCGVDTASDRFEDKNLCSLCGMTPVQMEQRPSLVEVLRRDLNDRIDDLKDSIERHKREATRQEKKLNEIVGQKSELDHQLSLELERYDSAFVANVRDVERKVATLQERLSSLQKLSRMPTAINDLERAAGNLQGEIDVLKSALLQEKERMAQADEHIKAIARTFLEILQELKFPGVDRGDTVRLEPRNWLPYVVHGDQQWSFSDAGSGGKKTLFNVCYALAVHKVAVDANLSLPKFLIIDSPTKNISRDENPALVEALYSYIYSLAIKYAHKLQFILIDSDLVEPSDQSIDFHSRRMATGEKDHPPLIPYYQGP